MSSHRRTQPNKQVFLVCHYAWPICRNISSPCRDPREWQVTKSPFISFQANSSHQAHWEQKNPGHKSIPLLHRWAPPIIVEGLSDPLVLGIQLINSGKINKIWNQNQHMFGTAASSYVLPPVCYSPLQWKCTVSKWFWYDLPVNHVTWSPVGSSELILIWPQAPIELQVWISVKVIKHHSQNTQILAQYTTDLVMNPSWSPPPYSSSTLVFNAQLHKSEMYVVLWKRIKFTRGHYSHKELLSEPRTRLHSLEETSADEFSVHWCHHLIPTGGPEKTSLCLHPNSWTSHLSQDNRQRKKVQHSQTGLQGLCRTPGKAFLWAGQCSAGRGHLER